MASTQETPARNNSSAKLAPAPSCTAFGQELRNTIGIGPPHRFKLAAELARGSS